jgi:hypothetical protein
MHRRPLLLWSACTAVLLISGVTAPSVAAQIASEDWVIERFEWRGTLPDGAQARLVNAYGDLRVRPGQRDEVYVLANIQHHREDARPVDIHFGSEAGALEVEVVYPDSAVGREHPAEWNRRRVDLTVLLPASTRVEGTTVAGLAEFRGLSGEVSAVSETGEIRWRGSGALVARTQHGAVLAQFRRGIWKGRAVVETSTGAIRAELPRDADVTATAQTRGEISTDYSMRIEFLSEELKRGVVGEASEAVLVLKSYSGPVKLLRSRVAADQG